MLAHTSEIQLSAAVNESIAKGTASGADVGEKKDGVEDFGFMDGVTNEKEDKRKLDGEGAPQERGGKKVKSATDEEDKKDADEANKQA